MRVTFFMTLGIAGILTAAACGGGQPEQAPAPQPNADSIEAARRAREDSLAREQARRDSIARAQAEADRLRRAREDSIAAARRAMDEARAMLTNVINFDYDRSNIRPEDAQKLDQKVALLQANPALRIRITGHADERGSDEYNLALGNRRALSARQYLTGRGIAADRIETRSMGEEQPVDPASNEDAWARNRRAEFEATAGGDNLRRP